MPSVAPSLSIRSPSFSSGSSCVNHYSDVHFKTPSFSLSSQHEPQVGLRHRHHPQTVIVEATNAGSSSAVDPLTPPFTPSCKPLSGSAPKVRTLTPPGTPDSASHLLAQASHGTNSAKKTKGRRQKDVKNRSSKKAPKKGAMSAGNVYTTKSTGGKARLGSGSGAPTGACVIM